MLENFAQSESSELMIEDFDSAGLQKPSKTSDHESTELSKEDLEENQILYSLEIERLLGCTRLSFGLWKKA